MALSADFANRCSKVVESDDSGTSEGSVDVELKASVRRAGTRMRMRVGGMGMRRVMMRGVSEDGWELWVEVEVEVGLAGWLARRWDVFVVVWALGFRRKVELVTTSDQSTGRKGLRCCVLL